VRHRPYVALLGSLTLALALGVVATGGVATVAGAAVNGHCGDVVVSPLAKGTNLRVAGSTSTDLHVFPEAQDVTLAPSVAVDFTHPGLYDTPLSLSGKRAILNAGTRVSSYLIHGDLPVGHATQRLTATIGFSTNVVGVQILSATLTALNVHQLRVPGVTYATKFSGLELNANGHGDFVRLINARTIAVSFSVAGQIDDTRVITQGTSSKASALNGYRLLAADGGVFDFGGQQFYGSTGGRVLNQPIVAGVNTCGNAGYWFVARDGGVFTYGDALFHGSLGSAVVSSPVVAMAATPTGLGYYLAEANGTVAAGSGGHPFGDATLFTDGHGHTDASKYHLNQPVVGMATTPTGDGYWLLAGDGGIFSFGDAEFHGSTGNLHLVSPVIGFSPTRDGHGYWLFAADGGIFSFGDAKFHGSAGGALRTNPIVGMRVSPTGNGYWLTDSAGKVYPFGDAAFAGDLSALHLFRPVIGMM
jgi:hypothetical protein